jgi:NADH-quinone oxidoreductase subunit C
MTADELLGHVTDALGAAVVDTHARCGDATLTIGRDDTLRVLEILRDRAPFQFNFLMDVTAVDYLGREPRYEVVYHLYSLAQNHRLRVKVGVPEMEPWVHSLVPLWKSANWLEREAWDMYGIRFLGHPDPRRILMYEEFVGHPLRKDYPVGQRQPLTAERDPIDVGWKFNA